MRRFLTKRNILVLVILMGIAGWWWYKSSQAKAQRSKIKTVEVARKDIESTLTVSGKVVAERKATLNFGGSGKLGYIKVSEGDVVKKGQYLMGLDMGDIQAAERTAYYNYLAADANAKEVEDLVKGHDKDETFAQKNDRVTAQTARDKAYDAWITAQRAVRNANLVAPFDGVVTTMTVATVGDTVGVTDGLTVVDPESLYFETEVDEADLSQVTIGQQVSVTLDAFADNKFDGEVESIGFEAGVSDTGATIFPVRINIPVTNLRLGMNGDAVILLERKIGVLSIPVEAVVDGNVEKSNGEKTKVETGLESETEVEIISGLKEGEWIRLSL